MLRYRISVALKLSERGFMSVPSLEGYNLAQRKEESERNNTKKEKLTFDGGTKGCAVLPLQLVVLNVSKWKLDSSGLPITT